MANPIISIVIHFSEGKYELCENNTEKEKRLVDYHEDEHPEFHSAHPHDLESPLKMLVGDYYTLKQFTDFNPRILIPPPQKKLI